jgi:hypothetical protein
LRNVRIQWLMTASISSWAAWRPAFAAKAFEGCAVQRGIAWAVGEGSEERVPLSVVLDADGDPLIVAVGGVDALWGEVAVAVAEALDRVADARLDNGVSDEEGDGFGHGKIDVAAFTRALAFDECRDDSEGGEAAAELVGEDAAAEADRRAVRAADELIHAAGGFGAGAEGCVFAPGTGRAVAGELEDDGRRVERAQLVWAKAEPLHDAGDEVAADDVSFRGEFLRDRKPFRILEVDADAGFRTPSTTEM